MDYSDKISEMIFENTHFMIAFLDKDFNFIRVNKAYANASNENPEYFVGKNHFELYPNQENEELFKNVVESGEPYSVYAKPFQHPVLGLTYWDWNLQPLKDEKSNAKYLILSLINVTPYKFDEERFQKDQRKELEKLVEERTKELKNEVDERKKAEEHFRKEVERETFLLELYKKSGQLADKELYECVLDYTVNLTDSTIGFFHMISGDQKNIIITTWNSEALDTCTASFKTHYSIESAGNWTDCIQAKGPVVYNDFKNSPNQKGLPKGHTLVKRFMSIPIFDEDKVKFIFGVGNKTEEYNDHDIIQIQSVANELYKIIKQRRSEQALKEAHDNLEKKVKKRTNELEEAYKILKENEVELKNAIIDLERSNEELQSFAYITSHDLQEPLRTMGNYAGLLKHRYKGHLDANADEFLEFIAGGAARMKDMVQGLLEYSRVGREEKFDKFNAKDTLNIALTNLKSSIDECHAEVIYNSFPDIVADKSQITRVFQNLIGNALKFRKEGVLPKIHIASKKEDNEYIFSVQDNGIGLEEQYSDRIFEVFKRLHSIGEYEGAGIGLAIVKRIIDRHGGRIWVESSLGKGSTFYFTIPIKT
ncbi:ATP-binding protein [Methanobacterium sp.]|uniref:ATP-binding protein n=1 Tax=Methanobacterium sp. TaxID=2164 RepID=UPI003C73A654